MKKIPKIKFKTKRLNTVKGFEIIQFSDLFKSSNLPQDHDPFKHHRLNFFAILILTKGTVNHTLDFNHCPLQAGDCLFLFKEQVHAFDPNSAYHGYMVLFTEAFFEQYLSLPAITEIRKLCNYFIYTNKFHCPQRGR